MACYGLCFSGQFWSDYFHCLCHSDDTSPHFGSSDREFLLFYNLGSALLHTAMVQPALCDQHQLLSSQYS
uniref:Uncharacterized protein n=1 Tax=Anguilla anguilla TaxID=7936 RepID=A0A0E9PS85_ANGAN